MDKYHPLHVLQETSAIGDVAQLVWLSTERVQCSGRISKPGSYAVAVPPCPSSLRTRLIPTLLYMHAHENIGHASFLVY